MSIIGSIYEDVTTDVVGKIGSWQWLVTVVSTVLMMPALFNQYEDIFMLNPSGVLCDPSPNLESLNSSLCFVTAVSNNSSIGTVTVKCAKWHVKMMWIIWLKKSWLVFCTPKLKLMSTALICRFGLMFGLVIFGLISDSFGRKTSIIIDVISSLALGLVLTFCDSEGWFRLFIFLKSLFGSANLYTGLLLICEIASNTWRSTLNTIVMTPRLIATVCVVPMANLMSNLETFSFLGCLVCVVCIVLLRWCPESSQWLLFNRKIHLAENILRNAAQMNGIRLCGEFKIRPVNHRAYTCLDETTTCVGVITTPNIRTIFMVMSTFWTVYYFLWSTLYVKVYSEEKFNSSILLKVFCFVGLFGCLTIIASKKLALRHLLLIIVVLTGAVTTSIVYFPKGVVRIIASSIAISLGIIVHALILNMTPRLFAINIRATFFGSCQATGQLGSIISYIIFMSHPMSDVTYTVIVTVATLTLVGLCMIMPNVDGRELPDMMEDMDYYSELSKPVRWATQKTSSLTVEEVEMRIYSFGSGLAESGNRHSETRVAAQRIGFARLSRSITAYLRGKFARKK